MRGGKFDGTIRNIMTSLLGMGVQVETKNSSTCAIMSKTVTRTRNPNVSRALSPTISGYDFFLRNLTLAEQSKIRNSFRDYLDNTLSNASQAQSNEEINAVNAARNLLQSTITVLLLDSAGRTM